jgi:hypothetical protein
MSSARSTPASAPYRFKRLSKSDNGSVNDGAVIYCSSLSGAVYPPHLIYNDLMHTLKIILTVLLVIPIGLMIYIIAFNPITYERNSLRELTFLVVGLPILMANFFVWFTPDLVQSYFSKEKKEDGA